MQESVAVWGMKRILLWFVIAAAVLLFWTGTVSAQNGDCAGMTAGQLTSLNGFVPFFIQQSLE